MHRIHYRFSPSIKIASIHGRRKKNYTEEQWISSLEKDKAQSAKLTESINLSCLIISCRIHVFVGQIGNSHRGRLHITLKEKQHYKLYL